MAFRELTDNEVNMLSERQKQLYLEELELYRERCAFIDRIEELEEIEYPEIKPKYVYLSKIKANKAIDVSDINDSKIVIDKVFSPKTIDGKENAGQLESIIGQLDEKYEIQENGNVVIAKTIDNQFDAPNSEEIKLPMISVENPNSEVDYSFAEVEISDIQGVTTEADIYINEMKYEKINVENNISINTSHPEVNFRPEEVSGVNIDLNIKDNYKSPDIVEFNESKIEIENTKIFMPEEEKIDIELPDGVKVAREDIIIAEAGVINYSEPDKEQLIEIEKIIVDVPIVDADLDIDNKVELADITNVEMPEVPDIMIDALEVSIDKPIIASTDINKEFSFENKLIDNSIEPIIPVASDMAFTMPELMVNEMKINIEKPFGIDEQATDKIMQIINGMGDTYEK